MKPSIASKLAQLSERLDEVTRLLSSEEATRDMDAFRKLNRERAEIEPVVGLYHACLLYTSPSPRDRTRSRMPSSA